MRIAHLSDLHLARGPLAVPPGYVAEPAGFLLHVLDGSTCVTHSVAASHTAAVRAFLSRCRIPLDGG
jgi:hypothetical protein